MKAHELARELLKRPTFNSGKRPRRFGKRPGKLPPLSITDWQRQAHEANAAFRPSKTRGAFGGCIRGMRAAKLIANKIKELVP